MLAFLAFRYTCVAFALVISVLLGTGVLLRRHKNVLHRTFVLLAFSLSFYQFSVFMAMSAQTASSARHWAVMSTIAIYFSSILLLFFSYTFLHNQVSKRWIWKYLLITFAGGVATVFLVPGLVIDIRMEELNPKVIYSRNFGAMALIVTLNSLLSVVNFFQVWRGEKGLRSAQAPYLMGGVFGFWVLGSIIGFVFPLLGIVEVEGLAASGAILMLLPIGYIIMRYRLFDVSVAARRLLTYGITSLLLSGVYGILLLTLGYSFSFRDEVDFRTTVFPLVVASIVAAGLLVPVSRRVQEAMRKLFLRDQYDAGALSRSLAQIFRSISTLDRLLEEVLRKICSDMSISDGRIFLRLKETNRFLLTAREGLHGERSIEEISEPSVLLEQLQPGGDVLIREEWERYHFEKEAEKVQQEMQAIRAQVIIPLGLSKELTGFVILGNKFSGNVFTQQDVDFFRVFASQLAIAIDNSLLYSALRDDKLYQQTILNNLSSGVITVDLNNKVTAYNNTAHKILGLLPEQALGKPVGELSTTFEHLISEALTRQKPVFQEEIRVQLQSGSQLPLSLNLSPLRNADGETIGGLIVFTDLSEIKQLQMEMRRSERLASLGTLAAGIAHEIKNPLVSIKTFAQLFPERYNDDEFRSSYYSVVSQEIDRINTLVEHLLNLAKPASATHEPISLPAVLKEVVGLLQSDLEKCQIQLSIELHDEGLKVPADFQQIKQVFLNLLLNAKESIQSQGTITVRSRRSRAPREMISDRVFEQGQHYLVQIEDSGIGIPPKDLQNIFDPFFTTKISGNGLGLSITHKIITDHGGTISVESSPGSTVFSIYFPIVFEEALVQS